MASVYAYLATACTFEVSFAAMNKLDRDKLATIVFAALRIIAGVMFMCHGMQKLFGVLTEHQPPVGSQLWIGGVIELVTGALIAVGLFARAAAFVASGQMAVAYFQFHWGFHFDRRILPIATMADDTVLYCFLFLWISVRGAGPASLDHSIRGVA
jgi:putative oxidoreductase